ncbi:MAG: alkene reductase, partial [Acinetobacter sp.]
PLATFGYVVEQLDQRNIGFIFTREYAAADSLQPQLRPKFKGVWIANEKLTPASAKQILETEQADAVAFGLAYIANPDLLERLEHDLPLNQVQFETLYGAGAAGYTDYPVLEKLEV